MPSPGYRRAVRPDVRRRPYCHEQHSETREWTTSPYALPVLTSLLGQHHLSSRHYLPVTGSRRLRGARDRVPRALPQAQPLREPYQGSVLSRRVHEEGEAPCRLYDLHDDFDLYSVSPYHYAFANVEVVMLMRVVAGLSIVQLNWRVDTMARS